MKNRIVYISSLTWFTAWITASAVHDVGEMPTCEPASWGLPVIVMIIIGVPALLGYAIGVTRSE